MTGTCSLISSSNKSSVPSSEISRWVDSNHQPRNFKFPCSAVGIHRGKGHIIVSLFLERLLANLYFVSKGVDAQAKKLENQLWPCLELNQTSPLNIGCPTANTKGVIFKFENEFPVGVEPTSQGAICQPDISISNRTRFAYPQHPSAGLRSPFPYLGNWTYPCFETQG